MPLGSAIQSMLNIFQMESDGLQTRGASFGPIPHQPGDCYDCTGSGFKFLSVEFLLTGKLFHIADYRYLNQNPNIQEPENSPNATAIEQPC